MQQTVTAVDLVRYALDARQRAYAPYSHYLVGATVLTATGAVILGCNVENASYPATICAERVALTAAVAQGHRDFVAIAVASQNGGTPCGICSPGHGRLGLAMTVYIRHAVGNFTMTTVTTLLPCAWPR